MARLFDVWETRYHYSVICDGGSEHRILVTISPANGQSGRNDFALMERLATSAVNGLVTRKAWTDRYARVDVLTIP